MEWEPEVPGGWPGTTRISRKRTASVAGLKEIPAGTMKEMLSDAASVSFWTALISESQSADHWK